MNHIKASKETKPSFEETHDARARRSTESKERKEVSKGAMNQSSGHKYSAWYDEELYCSRHMLNVFTRKIKKLLGITRVSDLEKQKQLCELRKAKSLQRKKHRQLIQEKRSAYELRFAQRSDDNASM